MTALVPVGALAVYVDGTATIRDALRLVRALDGAILTNGGHMATGDRWSRKTPATGPNPVALAGADTCMSSDVLRSPAGIDPYRPAPGGDCSSQSLRIDGHCPGCSTWAACARGGCWSE